MAKKQSAENPETKPEAEAAAEKPAAQPKPEGKPEGKKPRSKAEKASPAAPPGEAAPVSAPAASSGTSEAPVTKAAPGPEVSTKKKGRPGLPPGRGKKLRNHLRNQRQKIAKEGAVSIKKAINLLKGMKRSKFDETVEIHMSLGVDTSQSDQLVRGTVPLPHGVGKAVRVAVFCQGENIAKAKEAGADAAGAEDLIERIQKQNWLEFDVALATQDLMGKVSRLGKVLGPRGLMPTPKAGTVITGDVAQAIKEFKAGKVEFRTDKGGNVHAGVGKISFEEDKLADNVNSFVEAIRHAKPTGIKGNYIKSVTLCSTMSPGIPVTV